MYYLAITDEWVFFLISTRRQPAPAQNYHS